CCRHSSRAKRRTGRRSRRPASRARSTSAIASSISERICRPSPARPRNRPTSRLIPRPDHRFDIDELLAGGAFAGRLLLGLLDLLPVAEGDDVEAAPGGERVEPFAAALARGAERAGPGILGDLLDDAVAIGAVG